jgi:hypothetical protein
MKRCECGKELCKELFRAENLGKVVLSTKYAVRALYPAVYGSQAVGKCLVPPELYLASLKLDEGLDVVRWVAKIKTKYGRPKNGTWYPYLVGRVKYSGRMEFSNGERLETKIEYSTALNFIIVDQLLNALSLHLDIPEIRFEDIKGLESKILVKNKIDKKKPIPAMWASAEYDPYETKIKICNLEIRMRDSVRWSGNFSSDKRLSVGEKLEREIEDRAITRAHLQVLKLALDPSNYQRDKPAIKINGEEVELREHLDGLLYRKIEENLEHLIEDVSMLCSKFELLYREIGSLSSEIHRLNFGIQTAKKEGDERLADLEEELKKKRLKLATNQQLIKGYGGMLITAINLEDDMKYCGFKRSRELYSTKISKMLPKMDEIKKKVGSDQVQVFVLSPTKGQAPNPNLSYIT